MNIFGLSLLAASMFLTSCTGFNFFKEEDVKFVTVKNSRFYIGDKAYSFLGTNFWWHVSRAKDAGGNRKDHRELDHLEKMGVKNLRIMASSEGQQMLLGA